VLTSLLGLLYGLAQGMRHAFEPDHLAAVSTLVAEQRSARASTFYAAAWGVGHATVLLVVGGALFLLRARVPDRVAEAFELVVAAMLVLLGVRALFRSRALRADRDTVERGHARTTAPHVHVIDLRRWRAARQPIVIGCVHGLAGSGALTALVLATGPSPAAGFVMLALYAGGAMLGMTLLAGVLGVPLARVVRSGSGMPILLGVSGAASLLLGIAWGYPIVVRFVAG